MSILTFTQIGRSGLRGIAMRSLALNKRISGPISFPFASGHGESSQRSIWHRTLSSTRHLSTQTPQDPLSPNPPNPPIPPTTPILSPHISPKRSSTRLQAYAPRLTAISHRTGVPFASLAGAFLVLHEITAIVPVILFFFLFQALGAGAGIVAWMTDLGHESEVQANGEAVKQGGWKGWVGGWMAEAEDKAERVGKRYGVLGYEKEVRVRKGEPKVEVGTVPVVGQVTASGATEKVANAVAAYVVVKALLPFRIGLSLALAPSFARFALYPIRRLMGRIKPKPKPPIGGNAS